MVTEQEQFDRLFGHMLGHQATEVAAIGLRSGLLASLADRPGATSRELASATDLDARYVAAWARGAFAHGLIDRTELPGREPAAGVGHRRGLPAVPGTHGHRSDVAPQRP